MQILVGLLLRNPVSRVLLADLLSESLRTPCFVHLLFLSLEWYVDT